MRCVLRLFLSAQGGAASLRCRPCVCEAGCLTSYVRFACTGGTASLRCWGMCGAGMPHLLCAFPGGGIIQRGCRVMPLRGCRVTPLRGCRVMLQRGRRVITQRGCRFFGLIRRCPVRCRHRRRRVSPCRCPVRGLHRPSLLPAGCRARRCGDFLLPSGRCHTASSRSPSTARR